MNGFLHKTLIGAGSGLGATVPMTAFMVATHKALPRSEQYPLPPRAITMNTIRATGAEPPRDEGARKGLTLLGHFGYGAFCGIVFSLLRSGFSTLLNKSNESFVWTETASSTDKPTIDADRSASAYEFPSSLGAEAAAGMGYGLLVWVVSYMGWLPAVRLFPYAPKSEPAPRNALMIFAHFVFGSSLAALYYALSRRL